MIRVTQRNAEKITAAIDEAQKIARVRTICRADVFDAVEEIEKRLSKLLKLKLRYTGVKKAYTILPHNLLPKPI